MKSDFDPLLMTIKRKYYNSNDFVNKVDGILYERQLCLNNVTFQELSDDNKDKKQCFNCSYAH